MSLERNRTGGISIKLLIVTVSMSLAIIAFGLTSFYLFVLNDTPEEPIDFERVCAELPILEAATSLNAAPWTSDSALSIREFVTTERNAQSRDDLVEAPAGLLWMMTLKTENDGLRLIGAALEEPELTDYLVALGIPKPEEGGHHEHRFHLPVPAGGTVGYAVCEHYVERPSSNIEWGVYTVLQQSDWTPWFAQDLQVGKGTIFWQLLFGIFGPTLLTIGAVAHFVRAEGRKFRDDLQGVQDGEALRLKDDYGAELQGFVTQINELFDTLQSVNESVRMAGGKISHDLVNCTRGLAGALREAGVEDPAVLAQIDRIRNIADQYEDQYRPLVQAAPSGIVDTCVILELIDLIFKSESLVHGATTQYFLGDLPPEFHGNIVRLRASEGDLDRIFTNLITNAQRYGNGQVQVSVALDDDALTVAVEDDGDGVPEEMKDTIVRAGTKLDVFSPGKGLGLSIVLQKVTRYQATLDVGVSPELGGARFEVRFPRSIVIVKPAE